MSAHENRICLGPLLRTRAGFENAKAVFNSSMKIGTLDAKRLWQPEIRLLNQNYLSALHALFT
jgi:hypothetical protein